MCDIKIEYSTRIIYRLKTLNNGKSLNDTELKLKFTVFTYLTY